MAFETDAARRERSAPVGGSLREVVDLAWPVSVAHLSTATMYMVDSAMVGRLGATELAAVGFGSVWLWTVFALVNGTASGVQTFVSQSHGAGEPRRCGMWTWQGLYAVTPAAVLFTLLLVPSIEPAVRLLGTSPELRDSTIAYALARLPGEVGLALVMALTGFFRGIGDTRTPLYVMLLANTVNAVLDYGLIFGELGLPRWGVTGAGAATTAGHWLAALVLLAAFLRKPLARRFSSGPVAPDGLHVRRFLRTSAPIGGQWFIGMTAFAVFTTVVARMGDASMAANQAFVLLTDFAFLGALGISAAAQTLVGRYIGAGDDEAVLRSFRTSMLLALLFSGVFAVLFVVLPGPLLRIFTDDPAVVALGRPLMLLAALFVFGNASAVIAEGGLRGAGDTRWPFVLETVVGWLFFVPLAYLLGVVLEGGLTGAWLGGLLYMAVLSLALLHRFRSGAWRKIRI